MRVARLGLCKGRRVAPVESSRVGVQARAVSITGARMTGAVCGVRGGEDGGFA
jgi:hypothetical protein